MKRVLLTLPAMLSAAILAAHFLRGGRVLLSAACLLATGLLLLRRRWAVVACRVLLLTGTAVWILTAAKLIHARRVLGAPYVRLTLILGAVAAFTTLAAWLVPDPASEDEPSAGSPGH